MWGEEGGVGVAEEQSYLVQGLHDGRSQGRSCFCSQCELVFAGDFDNSGPVLSGVCVSELFNFVL